MENFRGEDSILIPMNTDRINGFQIDLKRIPKYLKASFVGLASFLNLLIGLIFTKSVRPTEYVYV